MSSKNSGGGGSPQIIYRLLQIYYNAKRTNIICKVKTFQKLDNTKNTT